MANLHRQLVIFLALSLFAGLTLTTGCTRSRYRRLTDTATYSVLAEKSCHRPWELPQDFSVQPDARSRFALFGDPDDPLLPAPAPSLYAYQIPELYNRRRATSEQDGELLPDSLPIESIPSAEDPLFDAPIDVESTEIEPFRDSGVNKALDVTSAAVPRRGASAAEPPRSSSPDLPAAADEGRRVARLGTPSLDDSTTSYRHTPTARENAPGNRNEASAPRSGGGVQQASHQTLDEARSPTSHPFSIPFASPISASTSNRSANTMHRRQDEVPTVLAAPQPNLVLRDSAEVSGGRPTTSRRLQQTTDDPQLLLEDASAADEPALVPIPPSFWEDIPARCMKRMMEFETIREEYLSSYQSNQIDQAFRDDSPRLSLADIIEIALLNSRNFQSQKETLYRVALRLTQERFEYQTKFSAGNGHRTTAAYGHNRNGGTTVNNLNVPTSVNVDRAMVTGGDILARFANDVVLTFNGPQGFTADVGSDLLFNLSYSVLQRDVLFEGLTQSERDVVYAARDFARQRKILFVQLANQYYSLLLTYRSIEINSQNYIRLVRAFNEADAEYRATGARPRIEVDQVEQGALSGRSSLINSCNQLEQSLDNLKLVIGLPPELPINLDLTELFELTERDEATVKGELMTRSRRVLETELRDDTPDRAELLNSSINLLKRILAVLEKQNLSGDAATEESTLMELKATMEVSEARMEVAFSKAVLARELASVPPAPPLRIYRRTIDYVDSVLALVDHQILLQRLRGDNSPTIAQLAARLIEQGERSTAIQADVDFTRLDTKVTEAKELQALAEPLLTETDLYTGFIASPDEEELALTIEQVEWLLSITSDIETSSRSYGLIPVEIDLDDAMLTALVQRFDLQNERGSLADTWRSIKLAGDDLRSVLNLNASQTIRTRQDVNRGFDFTFDESATNLSLNFDTPLNRRSQRNAYRSSLINYNSAIRSLIDLEDQVKADIRDDIRSLQLGREQYDISVASAALANERVVSTQLQLRQGIEGVAARDFLEAQNTYAGALNDVADNHISYIRDRTQFFLDLESLTVNQDGFWEALYQEDVQPQPAYQFDPTGGPAYGELPPRLRYSGDIRRMESIPNGEATIYQPTASEEQ